MAKVVWFVLFLALVVSCLDQPDCVLTTNNNVVGVSFRTMFDGRGDTVAVIRVTATGTSQSFDSATVGTSIFIPVNYLTSDTQFRIQTLGDDYYLDLGYKVKPQFISSTCGERYDLSALAIQSASGMDSIKLTSSTLTNPAQGNINIYRCPNNSLVKLSFRQWYLDTLSRGKLATQAITSVTDNFSGLTYYSNASTNTVFLPINFLSTNATYTFTFADKSVKKLSLNYDLYSKTLFPTACGSQLFPRKLKVVPTGTSADFAIIHLRRDSVYDPPKTNYEVFSCPINNQITALFRNTSGDYAADTLISIKADYLTAPIYQDTIIASAILPINPNTNATTFTFQFNKKTTFLTLSYTSIDNTFHSECGSQKTFTLLTDVLSTGFTAPPKVTLVNVTYPIATSNLEITQ